MHISKNIIAKTFGPLLFYKPRTQQAQYQYSYNSSSLFFFFGMVMCLIYRISSSYKPHKHRPYRTKKIG